MTINKTTFLEIKDLQTTVKASWNVDKSVFEIICGSTYVGSVSEIKDVEPAFRSWLSNLSK
jgi:hypothetical protein